MRSKNAIEFIENIRKNHFKENIVEPVLLSKRDIVIAIEHAEKEMREKAIEAFKKCCPFYLTGICMEDKSPCNLYCSELQQFIELLDKTE